MYKVLTDCDATSMGQHGLQTPRRTCRLLVENRALGKSVSGVTLVSAARNRFSFVSPQMRKALRD